jgi:hypothetical protein
MNVKPDADAFYTQRYRIGGKLNREPGRTFWRRPKFPVAAKNLLPVLSSNMNIK